MKKTLLILTALTGLTFTNPAKAHSAAFCLGDEVGSKVTHELADPEAAAAQAAYDLGLSEEDSGNFRGGWMDGYNKKFGIDKHTGKHFSEEPNQVQGAGVQVGGPSFAQVDAQLNQVWQALTPEQRHPMLQDQRRWLREREKLPATEQVIATLGRIQWLLAAAQYHEIKFKDDGTSPAQQAQSLKSGEFLVKKVKGVKWFWDPDDNVWRGEDL